MAILTLKKPTLKARGRIVYEPKRTIEGNKGKVVNGRKRVDIPWWIVVECSDTISSYYRWWIEKEILNPLQMDKGIMLAPPMWRTHITVLDGRNEVAEQFRNLWKKYDGEMIEFEYSPEVYNTWKFWNLPVRCKFLDTIREELGFTAVNPRDKVVVPGFNYHITCGRMPE
jgi:hypothetical protein